MESVRRSQRVGRSKLGIEAVAETPALEKKKAGRQPSVRKALVDVTNTCSTKPDGPSRTRVAKKPSGSNELGNRSVLKLAVNTPLPSNARSSRKVVGSNTVTSSLSLTSKSISVIATAKDSTVKAVRVRKTKEQAAMVGSKVDPTLATAKTAAVVAYPKESALNTFRVRKAKEPAPVVGGKVLSVPISVDVSEISSVAATPQDPVVKVVRGRRAKEQAQLESNSGITDVSDPTSIVSQDIFVANQKISGPKSRRKVVQVGSPQVIAEGIGAIKEKMVCSQVQQLRTSQSSKKLTEKSSGLGETHSELKRTSVKPKRVVRSKKGVNDVPSLEFDGDYKSELLLTMKKGMERSFPDYTADCKRQLPSPVVGVLDNDIKLAVASGDSNCAIESTKKVSLKKYPSEGNVSNPQGGLVTPPCFNQIGVTARRKKGRASTPESDMKHTRGSEDKFRQRKTLKDAQLQTSGAKKDVLVQRVEANVQVENPSPKPKIKRGTGTQTSKKTEKGVSREVICSPASNQNICSGVQRSSGYEQSTGGCNELPSVVLKNAPVQQTVRRNVARGARKPVNYAEVDDLGSNKVSTFLSGTSIKRHDPSSTKVELPTVKQTTRKGRKKIVGATIAPTPGCIEKPLHDGSIDLVDDVIAIPTTIESSLEDEYERFKLEKLAFQNRAKKPLPAVTIELVESVAQTLTQSADSSIHLEEQCLSVPSTDLAGDIINSEEAAQTPARKFIHAARSPKGTVRASPNLLTAQVSEQGVHVKKPSLSGVPGAELSPQTTTVPRGQKRGRKENNVMITSVPVRASEPERLLIDADVDAKPSYISSPRDVSAISASDDVDKGIREFNGAHEHDEQVDTDKDDGMAKDDPDRALFEHEDQVCVDVSGKECNTSLFKPLASFDDADILKKLKDCCKTLGKPSPLQAHALPFLLAGRNVVVISESHAGYVHAYAVPVLQHVLKNKKRYVRKQPSPQCLVLADSPEIAQQITDSLEENYGSLRVKISKAVEDPENLLGMEYVKPGVAILVTTPNSLEKMLRDGSCSLALVSFVVLDGADCMVNNGYEESLRIIFDQAPKCQQTGVFSSTWEAKIEQLVEKPIPNSDTVKVVVSKSTDAQEQLPAEQVVHQIVEVLEEPNKDTRLTALLRTFQKGQKNRVLVYVLYKEEALHVEGLLQHRGWKVASVHGGIFEADRDKAVVSFQKGTSSVLVATDVAARGLAIPNVDYVINYSFPYTLCDYARRLGQTGRTGKRGIMHTFFLPSNQGRAKELVEVLREAGQNVPEELLHLTSPAKKKPRTEY